MWVCALVCWEIHGLLATGPAKLEVEKQQQQQQQRQKLRQQQQPTPIGRKQNMARRQGAATHCQKFLPHLVGMGVAQFLPRTWPLLAPPEKANPFFFGNQLHLLVFWLGWWNFLFLLSPFMFAKRNFGSLIFLCTAGVKRIPLAQQNNQMNEIKKVRNKRWQQIL